ncbi:MAG: hypothetical protein JRH15_15960, partial [Deltaproteobacteria bacterium]|nr:hypothetical protein [Deltaproteobacteria bacterium]
YAAGEKEISGVGGQGLCQAIVDHGHKAARFLGGKQAAIEHLKKIIKPNDLLLTLGAGDVWQVGVGFLANLENAVAATDQSKGDASNGAA